MLNLASPEAQANFHFSAAFQEFVGLTHTNIGVMFAGFGAQTNFLNLDLLLGFARLALPLGLFVLIFAVIDQAADRGIGVGSDFDQVKFALMR